MPEPQDEIENGRKIFSLDQLSKQVDVSNFVTISRNHAEEIRFDPNQEVTHEKADSVFESFDSQKQSAGAGMPIDDSPENSHLPMLDQGQRVKGGRRISHLPPIITTNKNKVDIVPRKLNRVANILKRVRDKSQSKDQTSTFPFETLVEQLKLKETSDV
jgi:hypothetical protein